LRVEERNPRKERDKAVQRRERGLLCTCGGLTTAGGGHGGGATREKRKKGVGSGGLVEGEVAVVVVVVQVAEKGGRGIFGDGSVAKRLRGM